MTKYEIISLVMSAAALLVPIVQLLYKKLFRKPKLRYYPNGKAIVFFNQSGSYVRIDGAFEAINESISIKRINLKVIRKSNNEQLNLTWSAFISPFTQRIMNASTHATELPHAFKIEKNNVAAIFIEFADALNTPWKKFNSLTPELIKKANELLIFCKDYSQALTQYTESDIYKNAKAKWEKELFWEIGKYILEITVFFNNKSKNFSYEIDITQSMYNNLNSNIDESLISILKSAYGVKYDYHCEEIELHTKEKDFL